MKNVCVCTNPPLLVWVSWVAIPLRGSCLGIACLLIKRLSKVLGHEEWCPPGYPLPLPLMRISDASSAGQATEYELTMPAGGTVVPDDTDAVHTRPSVSGLSNILCWCCFLDLLKRFILFLWHLSGYSSYSHGCFHSCFSGSCNQSHSCSHSHSPSSSSDHKRRKSLKYQGPESAKVG